jgi:hypothetical protein
MDNQLSNKQQKKKMDNQLSNKQLKKEINKMKTEQKKLNSEKVNKRKTINKIHDDIKMKKIELNKLQEEHNHKILMKEFEKLQETIKLQKSDIKQMRGRLILFPWIFEIVLDNIM